MVDVPGSMRLSQLAAFLWTTACVRRVYTAYLLYLEAVYFACPTQRTQPPAEHALSSERGLCGRDREQLARPGASRPPDPFLAQLAIQLLIYFGVPGYGIGGSGEQNHLMRLEHRIFQASD